MLISTAMFMIILPRMCCEYAPLMLIYALYLQRLTNSLFLDILNVLGYHSQALLYYILWLI